MVVAVRLELQETERSKFGLFRFGWNTASIYKASVSSRVEPGEVPIYPPLWWLHSLA